MAKARATKVGKSVKEGVKVGKNSLKSVQSLNFIDKAITFLKEVKIEAKKITWPERKQVLMTALMVTVFSVFVGAYLGLLDAIYNFILSLVMR